VVSLNIPTGIPLIYELDDDLKPVEIGGRYLDPEAAAAAIEAVKMQGKKYRLDSLGVLFSSQPSRRPLPRFRSYPQPSTG
jgi:hypothetical protein